VIIKVDVAVRHQTFFLLMAASLLSLDSLSLSSSNLVSDCL
jgi:hypothetical protein